MARNYRKKNKKGRKTNYNTKTIISQKRFPLGQRLATKLRYFDTNIQLDSGVGGTPNSHVFSANGLYDPDNTGLGHQPTGFDQLMSMYDHYTVVGMKATVECTNLDGGGSQILAMYFKDNNTVSTDIRAVVENGTAKWVLVSPYVAGSKSCRKLSISCNPNKFLGRPNPLSEDDLRGSATANPKEQVFLHLITKPNRTFDLEPLACTIFIEYSVVFTEPKLLAVS